MGGTRGFDNGQDIVEFALALPLILLFTFGLVEFGFMIFRYNTMQ